MRHITITWNNSSRVSAMVTLQEFKPSAKARPGNHGCHDALPQRLRAACRLAPAARLEPGAGDHAHQPWPGRGRGPGPELGRQRLFDQTLPPVRIDGAHREASATRAQGGAVSRNAGLRLRAAVLVVAI